jgi:ribose 5-phosphate isomerase B
MKIAVGCDHAGVELKREILTLLKKAGAEALDFGAHDETSVDYPDFGAKAAGAVSRGEVARGVLICGTGLGMCIVANKFKGVRAALCHDVYTARLSRLHNDANVLVMGGRVIGKGLAAEILDVWLKTPYEGGRHDRRLKKISDIEESNENR